MHSVNDHFVFEMQSHPCCG